MMAPGFVSIVGAGPGDPELLTLRAADRLRRADVVLADALVSWKARRFAPRARWVRVGKRAGRAEVDQETITAMMIDAARGGDRVVRLKSGDPFVLGRGGEEALALAAAEVPFEIVPGVSAAIAAPALAGVPVTHRGLASGFLVVSGHAETAFGPILDAVAPGSVTVVVLMGMANRRAIARRLASRGWAPTTPAALLLAASTERARVWVGQLSELGGAPADDRDGAPGTIVVGGVVALAPAIGPLLAFQEELCHVGSR